MSRSARATAGFPTSKDTRLLLAGVVAIVGLALYLAVAFANTHPSQFATAPSLSSEVAPWSPHASRFSATPRGGGSFAVRVTPASQRPEPGGYGAVVQTLVPDPTPGGTYSVSLWMRGARPGRIGVELNEFRPGVSRYPVQTTVPATARWHHFTFNLRVRGRWLGLAMYVYRVDNDRRTWFAVRSLSATLLRQ